MSDCRHLNAVIQSYDRIGTISCPNCKEAVPAKDVINGWFNELRELRARMLEVLDK